MPLYERQVDVKDFLFRKLTDENILINKRAYLAGQTGVGKTYITSALVADMLKQHAKSILIVTPSHVRSKWQKVLKKFTDAPINILNTKACENNDFTTVNILSKTLLNALPHQTHFDLLIIDESHEYKTKRNLELLDQLLHQSDATLLLSGTHFTPQNKNDDSTMLEQIKLTHFNLLRYMFPNYNAKLQLKENKFDEFIKRVWSRIAAQITIEDIDATKTLLQSNIHPVISVKQSPKMRLQYQYLKRLYANLLKQPNKIKTSNVLAEIIDNIESNRKIEVPISKTIKEQYYQFANEGLERYSYIYNLNVKNVDKCSYAQYSNKREYNHFGPKLCGFAQILTPDHFDIIQVPSFIYQSLHESDKYQALINLIKAKRGQLNLILVKTAEFGQKLAKTLTEDKFKISLINKKDLIKIDAETYLKRLFSKTNTCIAVADNIKTGLDIDYVDNLIWYQFLDNPADIIQANGRVYRATTTKRNDIYFICYADTSQSQVMTNLVENLRINQKLNGGIDDD